MIRNSSFEELNVFLVYVRPTPKLNQNISNLINGKFFVQTIGEASEVLKIKLTCKWSVLQELLGYSVTKEVLEVEFLDLDKKGVIMEMPDYDLGEMHETNPTYIVTFDLAVIPDV